MTRPDIVFRLFRKILTEQSMQGFDWRGNVLILWNFELSVKELLIPDRDNCFSFSCLPTLGIIPEKIQLHIIANTNEYKPNRHSISLCFCPFCPFALFALFALLPFCRSFLFALMLCCLLLFENCFCFLLFHCTSII